MICSRLKREHSLIMNFAPSVFCLVLLRSGSDNFNGPALYIFSGFSGLPLYIFSGFSGLPLYLALCRNFLFFYTFTPQLIIPPASTDHSKKWGAKALAGGGMVGLTDVSSEGPCD